jgi:multimeric flavodoxin WrbA
MKVLMINGSPHKEGNTYIALHEMEKIFSREGIETEILHIGNRDIRGCVACRSCLKSGKCVFGDVVNETAAKFEECDGLVAGSPVYYAYLPMQHWWHF